MTSLSQRSAFNANLAIEHQIIQVPSVRTMSSSHQEALLTTYNRYGFTILRCKEHTDRREDLLALKSMLGKATPHPRADQDGIVPIDNIKPVPGHIDSSHHEHMLHTDGSFSDTPEKIITLQCEVPAQSGGLSVLASAKAAYEHLAAIFPNHVHLLTKHNALTIKRTTQSSTRPIFSRNHDNYSIKFRMQDSAAEVTPSPEVEDMFEELCCFFTAPENRLVFQLEPGEILIGDNTAVVHGRTAFDPLEPRYMRRLNFDASGILCKRMLFGFTPQPQYCIPSANALEELTELV